MSGSAATFRPTCFMVTRLMAPARVAPAATSKATFSLEEYSKAKSPSGERRKKVSGTSEDGVPG